MGFMTGQWKVSGMQTAKLRDRWPHAKRLMVLLLAAS